MLGAVIFVGLFASIALIWLAFKWAGLSEDDKKVVEEYWKTHWLI
jgi:hypothetical protein